MTSPENRHCANCIGALSFPIYIKRRQQKDRWLPSQAISLHTDIIFCYYVIVDARFMTSLISNKCGVLHRDGKNCHSWYVYEHVYSPVYRPNGANAHMNGLLTM